MLAPAHSERVALPTASPERPNAKAGLCARGPCLPGDLRRRSSRSGPVTLPAPEANTGDPKPRDQRGSIVTLMKLSTNRNDFKLNLEMFHSRHDVNGGANLWSDSDLGL